MRFWAIAWMLYVLTLVGGLILPVLGRLDRGATPWLESVANPASAGALLVAPVVLAVMVARWLFPRYWWLGNVSAKDIYEYDGVYFVGSRATRQKNRLYRIIFGLDDTMRRWNIAFGLMLVALVVPHLMGGYTSWRLSGSLVAERPVLHETLHGATLSAFPVMRGWRKTWSARADLAAEVHRALRKARADNKQDNGRWFRIAQLQLLNAFRTRADPREPFLHTPGDSILFNRSEGAEAVSYLKRILDQPEAQRKGWTRGALALIGFFHLSDRNLSQAEQFFQQALNTAETRDRTGIARHLIALLAAQTAISAGRAEQAELLLENVLTNNELPEPAYALALEHFAAALRLRGRPERVADLLAKALAVYKKQKNRAGIARTHLRLAALALEQGRGRDAGHELSLASSLAYGLEDGFTLNMVEGLTQFFPRVL